jgi:hypothetical protein
MGDTSYCSRKLRSLFLLHLASPLRTYIQSPSPSHPRSPLLYDTQLRHSRQATRMYINLPPSHRGDRSSCIIKKFLTLTPPSSTHPCACPSRPSSSGTVVHPISVDLLRSSYLSRPFPSLCLFSSPPISCSRRTLSLSQHLS